MRNGVLAGGESDQDDEGRFWVKMLFSIGAQPHAQIELTAHRHDQNDGDGNNPAF